MQLVGPLDRSYPVGLVLVSGALGMIHDPALWSDEDGLAFAGLLEEAIEEAVRP